MVAESGDLVSVVVPTRNRPDHVAACVTSILACPDDRITVTVVDQSDDDATSRILAGLADPRVHHRPTDTRGAANARNLGVTLTEGSIVAFTDDDCRVDRSWVDAFRDAFDDPAVGMVFGSVVKGESDDPSAQAAEFLPGTSHVVETLPPVREPWGISASMAIRRTVFDDVGGFDAMLGPGAPINTGGEDSDLFIRVLAAGHKVAVTNETRTVHLGFRSGHEASDLYRGYAYALGAVFAKHLRLGTRPGRDQLPRWLAHFGRQTLTNLVRGRGPNGAGFVIGLIRGAVAGARLPIDASHRRFIVEGSHAVSDRAGRRLRIAVGIHSLQLGGSQLNTIDLSSRLRDRGHDVMIFAIDEPAQVSVEPVAKEAGFEIVRVPTASTLRTQAGHITDVVDDHAADMVHVYHEDHWLGPLGAIALLRRPGRALVVTNWMMRNNPWLPRYAPLIVGTQALVDEAKESFQKGPVWLLEPPVDTDSDSPDPARAAAFRRDNGFADNEILVVMVTRVDRLMKLESILQSIAAVQRLDRPDLRLVIVGDGDAMAEVRSAAAEANQKLGREAVVLTGTLHDPRPAYDAADIVLAMGGSALRGLAFARPVIVVGARGFCRPFTAETAPYFLRNGYYGEGDGDTDGSNLAGEIENLLDPDHRDEVGAYGASVLRERYALDVLAERLEGFYQAAVASPPTTVQRWLDVAYVLAYDLVHRTVPAGLKNKIRQRFSRLRRH